MLGQCRRRWDNIGQNIGSLSRVCLAIILLRTNLSSSCCDTAHRRPIADCGGRWLTHNMHNKNMFDVKLEQMIFMRNIEMNPLSRTPTLLTHVHRWWIDEYSYLGDFEAWFTVSKRKANYSTIIKIQVGSTTKQWPKELYSGYSMWFWNNICCGNWPSRIQSCHNIWTFFED